MAKRILIADPSGPLRRNLVASLVGEGFECFATADGLEALTKAFYDRPDVILIDPDVQGFSGPNLCQALKASASTALIPIIFMAANYSTDTVVHALESGAVDCLQKPLSISMLLGRILRHTTERYVVGQSLYLVGDECPVQCKTKVVSHFDTKLFVQKPNWSPELADFFVPGAFAELHHTAPDATIHRRRVVLGATFEGEPPQVEVFLASGVYMAQRRMTFRKDVSMPVRYKTEGGYFRVATIADISGFGLRLVGVSDTVEIGQELLLEFRLPESTIREKAVVVWRNLTSDLPTMMGLQVADDSDPKWRLEMTKYLFAELFIPAADSLPT